MSNTVETTATQGAAATGSSKTKEVDVDGEAFASELSQHLSEPASAKDKAISTMERLAQSLSGLTVSRGTAPELGDSPAYFVKNGESGKVTISDEMLAQMADDEDMFAKVKDMINGLFTAGKSQPLTPLAANSAGGKGQMSTWQNVVVDVESTRYVEVTRDGKTGTSSISSLTLATQEIIYNALDLLLNSTRQGNSKNNSSNRNSTGSAATTGFSNLMTNSESWRFEMSFSSLNQATETLRASQNFIANLDVLIEQQEFSFSSGGILGYMQAAGLTDPLVFDLGGEGINLTSAENGVYFDIKGDGSPVQTAWITGKNAFLYLDENGNGLADDANELFGDHGGFANGFEKLAQYDSNGDGIIDSNDEIYSQLRLWQDLNGDGVNQENESLSLADVGIASIDLGYSDTKNFDGKGNVIGERSTFTWADGRKGDVADAWLKSL